MAVKELSVLIPDYAMEALHKRYLEEGYLPVDFDAASSSLIYKTEDDGGTPEAHAKFMQVLDKFIKLEVTSSHEHP